MPNEQLVFERFYGQIEKKYLQRTKKSREIYQEAKRYLPGGNTRSVTYFKPYPLFIAYGKGCRLYDVEGNSLIDFLNNFTSLILGHAHPRIVEAVQRQVEKGTAYAANSESQYKLAKTVCDRLDSVDMIRFANSGTEGVMNAIKGSRAYTRKDKFLKMEGGYNGTWDAVQVSVKPKLDEVGPVENPNQVPESLGIPENVVKDTLITPFNNSEIAEAIIRKHREELAAVIVEPVMGSAGMIPPRDDFLKALRDITHDNDVLLIFDEVITFRLSRGGAQEIYGVKPDMTALGKIIGGGFPVGAFGGREDIMEIFSPEGEKPISHSGTFNGNPITVEAGLATMRELTHSAIENLNTLGESLRREALKILEEVGVVAQLSGCGSLYNLHFTDKEIVDYRCTASANKTANELLHLAMINNGIFMAKRSMFDLSTPMTKEETKIFTEALRKSLTELRPYIEETAPHLITRR
ncbi:MAG: aminotransferase class III-fold pyridoxal phosphate-dependent enzyme [Nitrososphaeria archaeon]|nr:aminotransferase class III-fold pyridoxal phosphate-dependent enzyme [Nitrososphaeria archaeon]NIN52559.1 aminotransferase class III-fold pyridoxal phosphate-dependent enzyme [Nitrososphaeria archaeon]NIQ33066.1 aminotransferase class III-fold pyridoxal phosphate-dependent enzyme [Nitrososphaeria archaeon]